MILQLPNPHPGQLQVLQSNAKYKVLMCGRRWGKSLICQLISLQSIFEGQRVAYITPTNSLGKEFYREVLKIIQPYLQHIYQDKLDQYLKVNGTDLRIEIKNGGETGTLEFFSGEPEALEKGLRGRKFHKVIVDEAAKINDLENAWINVILPTLIDYDGDALLVSTPRGMNYFYSLYQLGLKGETDYASWNFRTHDNPYLNVAVLAKMQKAMTAAAYKQEMLAEPTANERNPFSADAIQRNTMPELSKNETIVYGIDLGSRVDYSVIVGLDEDGNMTHYDCFQLGWIETMEKLKTLPSTVVKVIDATGLGAPVYEQLENIVKHLRPFVFTNSSKQAIVQQLIKDVETDQVKFLEPVAKELSTMEQYETAHGNMKFEAQPGFHDDSVMALAMANHYRTKEHVKKSWRVYTA